MGISRGVVLVVGSSIPKINRLTTFCGYQEGLQ
jgi:hypothetical protein